jgi:altronate dehydratase
MSAPPILSLGERDNVVVAVRPLAPGQVVETPDGERVTVRDPIPFGHKLAVRAIPNGEEVIKYDEVIGLACADIPPGAHVHVENVVSARLPGTEQSLAVGR